MITMFRQNMKTQDTEKISLFQGRDRKLGFAMSYLSDSRFNNLQCVYVHIAIVHYYINVCGNHN